MASVLRLLPARCIAEPVCDREAPPAATTRQLSPTLYCSEKTIKGKVNLAPRKDTELLPQLYLHGLALGDFELALRGLLGEGAPLSPASLLRLKTQWQLEYETWKQRRLNDLEVVYIRAESRLSRVYIP